MLVQRCFLESESGEENWGEKCRWWRAQPGGWDQGPPGARHLGSKEKQMRKSSGFSKKKTEKRSYPQNKGKKKGQEDRISVVSNTAERWDSFQSDREITIEFGNMGLPLSLTGILWVEWWEGLKILVGNTFYSQWLDFLWNHKLFTLQKIKFSFHISFPFSTLVWNHSEKVSQRSGKYIYKWINGQKYFSYDYVITFTDFESISNQSSRTDIYGLE